jgi:transcriptional regulator with XRE-family HTH domain
VLRLCIREVAESKHFSMGELSRRANVTPGVLRDAYRYPETYNIGIRTLEKLALVLGVPVSDLFKEIDAA